VHTLRRQLHVRAALDPAATSAPTDNMMKLDVNYYDVDEICGVRIVMVEDEPTVEYRVKWKVTTIPNAVLGRICMP
jgi:hypothetical protein